MKDNVGKYFANPQKFTMRFNEKEHGNEISEGLGEMLEVAPRLEGETRGGVQSLLHWNSWKERVFMTFPFTLVGMIWIDTSVSQAKPGHRNCSGPAKTPQEVCLGISPDCAFKPPVVAAVLATNYKLSMIGIFLNSNPHWYRTILL